MRTIACSDLGHRCSWKASARTEDLLLDVAAVHLRDAHGKAVLTAEEIGKLRNMIGSENLPPQGTEDEPDFKEFRCADMGNDCGWHYIALTEELIADGVAIHAREAHGIVDFTPEMIAKVKMAVHAWNG